MKSIFVAGQDIHVYLLLFIFILLLRHLLKLAFHLKWSFSGIIFVIWCTKVNSWLNVSMSGFQLGLSLPLSLSLSVVLNDRSVNYALLFLNGPAPASFSFIFGLFKQTIQFLQQIYVKKYPSSIRCRDLNPQPSKTWVSSHNHQTRAPAQLCIVHCTKNGLSTFREALQAIGRPRVRVRVHE